MKKFLLLFLFTSIFLESPAQEHIGAWRMGYSRKPVDTNSADASSFDPTSVDDNEHFEQVIEEYELMHGIVELEEKRVTIHNFNTSPIRKKIKHNKKKGYHFNYKGARLLIDSSSQDSLVLQNEQNKEEYIVLFPYHPDYRDIHPDELRNGFWKVGSESEEMDELELYFVDSTFLFLTQVREDFGYTTLGEWKIYQSGKYHLLLVADNNHGEEYIFYPLSKSEQKIEMVINSKNFGEMPTQIKVELNKKKLLTSHQIVEKEKKLISEWHITEFQDIWDEEISDSLIYLNFSINFLPNHQYEIYNTVKGIYFEKELNFVDHQEGSWKVSDSGSYLVLKPTNNHTQLLTIVSLRAEKVKFDLDYQVEEHSYIGPTRIELQRKN